MDMEGRMEAVERLGRKVEKDLYDGDPVTGRPGIVNDYWERIAARRERERMMHAIIVGLGSLGGLDMAINLIKLLLR